MKLPRIGVPLVLLAALVLSAPAAAQVNSSGLTHLFNSNRTPATVNSDLAFWGNRAYAGDYDGFRIFDISNPTAPVLLSTVTCTTEPGLARAGQGDISVWGNRLVFRSVDTAQTSPNCATRARTSASTGGPHNTGVPGWEGIDIFDVSNPAAPQEIAHVATDCGSHTHTLVPDLANNRLLLYVSSYPAAYLSSTPTQWGNTCEREATTGAGTRHDKISIVEVPLNAPQNASVISELHLNLDGNFLGVAGFKGCHDISVFMELRVAAGACLTEGVMFDISNPANPVITHRLVNPAIDTCSKQAPPAGNPLCLWHSATFTWEGRYVVFGDEAGGGGSAECAADDPPTRGAFWIHRVSNPTNPIASFKIPRVQPAPQICTAHIMNFVPINGRYILPSSWYAGGTSVIDWTNVTSPSEMAWFEIEPGGTSTSTDTWTTYWYNDFIYANDINRGFDVFRLDVPWRTRAWNLARFNPQTQENLMRCRTMAHGSLRAKQRRMLHVQVRVLGQPVAGTTVNLRGAGVRASRRTNASGEVQFTIRPSRRGTVNVNVPTALNMVGCSTSKRVAAAPRRAGVGAGLTGRVR